MSTNAQKLNKEVAQLMTEIDGRHYGTGYAGRVVKEAQASDPNTWDNTPYYNRTQRVIDFWLDNYGKAKE
jgi:hypothetical protein